MMATLMLFVKNHSDNPHHFSLTVNFKSFTLNQGCTLHLLISFPFMWSLYSSFVSKSLLKLKFTLVFYFLYALLKNRAIVSLFTLENFTFVKNVKPYVSSLTYCRQEWTDQKEIGQSFRKLSSFRKVLTVGFQVSHETPKSCGSPLEYELN